MIKICALVVTYNRKLLLEECIAAIQAQTFPVDSVIVIDNASTDGSKEYIDGSQLINHQKLQYFIMADNLGGAGGFYEGLKRVQKSEYDFVWLMDDDTIPEKNALQELVNATDVVRQFSFLASAVIGSHSEAMNVPTVQLAPSENGYAYWYKYLRNGIVEISSATFVSLLIKVDAVKKCGLPCKDYFLWGDDNEYTMRLVKHYDHAYFVGKSIVIHKRNNARKLNIREENDESRIKRYYLLYRNILINTFCYDGKRKAFSKTVRFFLHGIKLMNRRKSLIVFKGIASYYYYRKKFQSYISNEISSASS